MGRTPHVVRIGEPTQGVYSDVPGRRLPNGGRFVSRASIVPPCIPTRRFTTSSSSRSR
jgi:hypothetical protein